METPAEAATLASVVGTSSDGTTFSLASDARWANVDRRDEAAVVTNCSDGARQPYLRAAGEVPGGTADEDVDFSWLDDPLEIPAGKCRPVGVNAE
jgi:hypothetical protein